MFTKPIDPKYLKRFHLTATVIWFLLIPPSVLLWKESVPWLVIMSAWANFAAHFSAWQGARSEMNGNNGNDNGNNGKGGKNLNDAEY